MSMPSPRSRKVESKLNAYRSDPSMRADLEERVAGYRSGFTLKIQLDAPMSPGPRGSSPSSLMTPTARAMTPASRRSAVKRSKTYGGSPRTPGTPGTACSWSALDTSLAPDDGDPVGGWKQIAKNRVPGEQPPLRFGFESEGARRRAYAERTTIALLGPQEAPLCSGRDTRDTESTNTLIHSPLPRTLRPTRRLERGIHASAMQPHAQSTWQPATRSSAWSATTLSPQPLPQPTPHPAPPSAKDSAERALQRSASASSPRKWREAPDSLHQRVLALRDEAEAGAPVPSKLSLRAMRRLRDSAAPLTSARLGRLVGADQPGATIVRQVDDLDRFALAGHFMSTERSVLSTPSRRIR